MADGAAGAENADAGSIWGTVARMTLVYFCITNFMGGGGTGGATPAAQPQQPGAVVTQQNGNGQQQVATQNAPVAPLINAWVPRQPFDLRLYITEEPEFRDFSDQSALVWYEPSMGYVRDDRSSRAKNISITPSARLLRNESMLYAHLGTHW